MYRNSPPPNHNKIRQEPYLKEFPYSLDGSDPPRPPRRPVARRMRKGKRKAYRRTSRCQRVNDRSEYRPRLVRSRAVYRLLHATTIRSHPPPKLTAEGLSMRRRDAIARGTSRVERSRGQHLWPLCSRCLRLRLSPSAACRRGDPHPPSSSLAASRAGAARATALRAWRSVPMVEALSMALSRPWAVCSRGSVRSADAGGCRRGRGRRRAPNRRPRRDPQRSRACRARAPWRRRRAAAR